MAEHGPPAGPWALEVRGFDKRYGPTHALAGVDVKVRRGEIHALLGGNGSGKSTLIKILAGVESADAGEVVVNGETVAVGDWDSLRAHKAGLRFCHQHASVFPDLTVAENLTLGREYDRASRVGPIKWAKVRERAGRVLERFELKMRPDALMTTLSAAEHMMIAIARALQDQEGEEAGVLVLDEPTAALPAHEVGVLFAALRRFALAGQTIVYVSHRLDEVMDLADRATILRDGRVAVLRDISESSEAQLANDLAGGVTRTEVPRASGSQNRVGDVVLQLQGVSSGSLSDVTFSVREGEAVGVVGLLGTGRSRLLKTIFGVHRAGAGRIVFDNAEAKHRATPRASIDAGMAFIPEDRAVEGTFADLSVRNNIAASRVSDFWTRGILRRQQESDTARQLVKDFGIKTASVDIPLSKLSGGNQQKVVLARWMRLQPRLLLLDEPSQGVDVVARADIHGLIKAALSGGAAALVVSSDFAELAMYCDRYVVIRDGTCYEVPRGRYDASDLTELAYGAKEIS